MGLRSDKFLGLNTYLRLNMRLRPDNLFMELDMGLRSDNFSGLNKRLN